MKEEREAYKNKHAIGRTFGDLTVLDLIKKEQKSGRYKGRYDYRAICKCNKCGEEGLDKRISAVKALKARCSCSKNEWQKKFNSGKNNPLFRGYEEVNSYIVSNAMRRAKKLNLDCDIDAKFLWELFLFQNRKCKLSGMELVFTKANRDRVKATASLDRIDNKKGYTKDNVQWVHKDINYMKNDMDEEYFRQLCKNVCQTNK